MSDELQGDSGGLSHLNAEGEARMVDVGDKAVTARRAIARARVVMAPATLALIQSGGLPKGDVLAVARVAGIQGAKRCAELIPLCHPLALSGVDVTFEAVAADTLDVIADCRVAGRTGVEMEALTAASISALTIYDMCKAVDRGMRISDVELLEKSGGRSGHWQRDGAGGD